MSGKVIVVNPNGQVSEHPWHGPLHEDGMPAGPFGLKFLQDLLGGWLEGCVVEWEGVRRWGYIDEEGKMKGLADNMVATKAMASLMPGDHIAGPLLIWIP